MKNVICLACLILAGLALFGCQEEATEPGQAASGHGYDVRYDGAGVIGTYGTSGTYTRTLKNYGRESACDVRWIVTWSGQEKVAEIGVLAPGQKVERTLRFDNVSGNPSARISAGPC